jgi:hypothetical protein
VLSFRMLLRTLLMSAISAGCSHGSLLPVVGDTAIWGNRCAAHRLRVCSP